MPMVVVVVILLSFGNFVFNFFLDYSFDIIWMCCIHYSSSDACVLATCFLYVFV
jgi:hypothetical protein